MYLYSQCWRHTNVSFVWNWVLLSALKGEVVLLQAQQEKGKQLHEIPSFMSRELNITIPPPSKFWCEPEVFRMISPPQAGLQWQRGRHTPHSAALRKEVKRHCDKDWGWKRIREAGSVIISNN